MLWLALTAALACGQKEDIIVETADGVEVTAEQIDSDPWALLPGSAVGWVRVDTQAMFASAFGQRLRQIAEARVPLPPSAGFEPNRDLTALHIGLYSMQGADFAAVATGRFNRAAIEKAADGTSTTPLGAPLVKQKYSKWTLYVSRNVGFVVLTERTVLLGNETGIRRALDRLETGRPRRSLPRWMDKLLATPRAAIILGFDVKGQPEVKAVAGEFSFLEGLETARALGNFEPPGMNFAGTLTYPDEAAAQRSAASIQQLHQSAQAYGWIMKLMGITNPIRDLKTQPVGSETQFVVSVDGPAVEWLIGVLADRLGVPAQPVQANLTSSPAVAPGPAAPSR